MKRSLLSYILEFHRVHFQNLTRLFLILFSISILSFIARIGFDVGEWFYTFSAWINVIALFYTLVVFILQIFTLRHQKKSVTALIALLFFFLIIATFLFVIIFDTHLDLKTSQAAYVISEFLLFVCLFTESYAVQKRLLAIPLSPFQLLSVSFIVVIMIGTLFLMLPNSTHYGISFIDALFTSTSAVCVTGLVVFDTGTMFTLTGQTIILLLIQVGGLGIITITAFFTMMGGEKSTLKDALIAQEVAQTHSLNHIPRFLIRIILITFSLEISAMFFLKFWWDTTFFDALFHSVSAYCNAGFSLYENSFMNSHQDGVSLMLISFLVIVGGIGIFVISDLIKVLFRSQTGKRFRISNQTVMVLKTSGILLILGFVLFAIEAIVAGTHESIYDVIVHSFFQSSIIRTAGFNSIDIGSLTYSLSFWVILLMFIGGGSGSTAGGIKVNTMAVLILKITSLLKKQKHCIYRRRTISDSSFNQAILVLVLSTSFVAFAIILLVMTQNLPLIDIIFETVSAFATVGLSRGITPELNVFGKLVIIMAMFVGRIGVVSFALSLVKKETGAERVLYPEEELQIG
jgi:trk system potassium uptake protein TrkH